MNWSPARSTSWSCAECGEHRIKVPAQALDGIEELVREETVVPRPAQAAAIPVRDPDDAWVLASTEAAGVDVLVTGDRDLLDGASQALVRILNPRGFWELARQHEASDS